MTSENTFFSDGQGKSCLSDGQAKAFFDGQAMLFGAFYWLNNMSITKLVIQKIC